MASKMSIEDKKKILIVHLPFVNRMITKATGTTYEKKWKNMKDSIVLETKLAKYLTEKLLLISLIIQYFYLECPLVKFIS